MRDGFLTCAWCSVWTFSKHRGFKLSPPPLTGGWADQISSLVPGMASMDAFASGQSEENLVVSPVFMVCSPWCICGSGSDCGRHRGIESAPDYPPSHSKSALRRSLPARVRLIDSVIKSLPKDGHASIEHSWFHAFVAACCWLFEPAGQTTGAD